MPRRTWTDAEKKQIQDTLQASPERREQLMTKMAPDVLKAIKRRLAGITAGRVRDWINARLKNRETLAELFGGWTRERLVLLDQWIQELINQRSAKALEEAERELVNAKAKVDALRVSLPPPHTASEG
jgi:hypothetical protein